MHTFGHRELSNMAWALAIVEFKHTSLLRAIAEAATSQIKQFGPQSLWNIAWAVAAMKYCHGPLIVVLGDTAADRSAEFSPQGLSNFVWALATLAKRDQQTAETMAAAVLIKIPQFNAQALANTSWAFATLWYRNNTLLHAVVARLPVKIAELQAQEFSNLVWSLAILAFPPKTADANDLDLVRTAQLLQPQFAPQHLANAAWAFAELQVHWTFDELLLELGPELEQDAKALASLVACNALPLSQLPTTAGPEVFSSLLSCCEESMTVT